MAPMNKALRIFLKILLVLVLLVPVSLATTLTVIVAGCIRPFSRSLSRRIAAIMPLMIWSVCHMVFRLTIKMELPPVPTDSSLVLTNHIGAADFMVVNALNTHHFTEAKYVFKHSLCFFPVFYQGCLLADFLVLRRSFEQDKNRIAEYIRDIISRRAPLWLVIFCEGHRITPERLQASREFCASRDIPPFNNVLCPRYKGFDVIVQNLHGSHVKNIIDLTFYAVGGTAPSLVEVFFSGKVFEYKCDLRVVPMEDVHDPVSFLEQAFRRKDTIIEKWKEEEFKNL